MIETNKKLNKKGFLFQDDLSASWTHPSMNMDCSRRNTRQASFVAAVSAGNGSSLTIYDLWSNWTIAKQKS